MNKTRRARIFPLPLKLKIMLFIHSENNVKYDMGYTKIDGSKSLMDA